MTHPDASTLTPRSASIITRPPRFAISDHAEPVSVRDAASGREQAGGPRSLVAESHDQTREGTDVPRRRRYVPGGPEVVG